ncbi:GNAT family N-acetyltransferase [Saccharospirillum salsuginis]|uniref:N-acetyltransferase n=1 Tax=Saccharospirillum salsuginis TaxID=418750 RepID=A0A918K1R8_9GAMM|nr:GNAT family N-acetyltransferase [Saccharospirillum salsuginis]GGX42155.1 N-acetyltransferase [Saccharospirillum salsuginis]
MNLKTSLGIQSEYVVSHLESELDDRDDYLIFKTPNSPDYFFGNLLALKQPLASKTREEWEACFDEAFKSIAGIRHRTFLWRYNENDLMEIVERFKQAGYQYQEEHILAMNSHDLITPDQLNTDFEIRPLTDESDWQQWVEIGVEARDEGHAESDFRHYRLGRMNIYRALDEQGCGRFYGVFDAGRLIGYAGVYHLNGLARFQDVMVLSGYRRRGIARTLIHHLAQWVAQYADRQVIIADAHYHATVLYQNLGFRIVEREAGLCWWPKAEAV